MPPEKLRKPTTDEEMDDLLREVPLAGNGTDIRYGKQVLEEFLAKIDELQENPSVNYFGRNNRRICVKYHACWLVVDVNDCDWYD